MSPTHSYENAPPRRFPRVSGDEPQRLRIAVYNVTFSPRERG